MILLGVPPDAPQLAAYNLISKRRRIVGSLIGSISETQECLTTVQKIISLQKLK